MLTFEQFQESFNPEISSTFDEQFKAYNNLRKIKNGSMRTLVLSIILITVALRFLVSDIILGKSIIDMKNSILAIIRLASFWVISSQYANLAKKRIEEINSDFYEKTLKCIFNQASDFTEFRGDLCLGEEEYNNCLLFMNASSYYGSYLFRNALKNIDISHIYSRLTEIQTDNKGNSSKFHTEIFNGIFVKATSEFPYNGYMKICPKQYISRKCRNKYMSSFYASLQHKLIRFVTEDKYFDKTYLIDGNNKESTSYILSKGILKKLDELCKKINKPVLISLKEEYIYVAIDNYNPIHISELKSSNMEDLYMFYKKMIELLEIPNTLNQMINE